MLFKVSCLAVQLDFSFVFLRQTNVYQVRSSSLPLDTQLTLIVIETLDSDPEIQPLGWRLSPRDWRHAVAYFIN